MRSYLSILFLMFTIGHGFSQNTFHKEVMNKGIDGVAEDMANKGPYIIGWQETIGNRIYEEVNRQHNNTQQTVGKNAASTDRNAQERNQNNPRNATVYTSGGIQIERSSSNGSNSNRSSSRNKQIKLKNKETRAYNEEVRRRRNEEIERHNQEVREHNERIELERKAREEARRQRLYREGYERAYISSAGRYNQLHNEVDQMAAAGDMIRNSHNIDGFARESGFIASSDPSKSAYTTKRSKAGIAPKRPHAIDYTNYPITQRFPENDLYKFEILDINPRPRNESTSKDTEKAFSKIRKKAGDGRYDILKHELLMLNNSKMPSFICYNDEGDAIFSGEDEESYFKISPNGDQVTHIKLTEKDTNILKDEKSVDFTSDIQGLGITTKSKYSYNESLSDKIKTDDNSYLNADIEKKARDTASVSQNILPRVDIEAKVKLLDWSTTASADKIWISDNGSIHASGEIFGGAKIEAESNINFDASRIAYVREFIDKLLKGHSNDTDNNQDIKKKGFFDATANAHFKTISVDSEVGINRVITNPFSGDKLIIHLSVNGKAGHDLSLKTYNTYGLFAKGNVKIRIDHLAK